MITIKHIIRIFSVLSVLLLMSVVARAYNVIDLPETMTFDEAFGVFSASDITRATVSNYADRRYVELSRNEINELYENMKNITLTRQTNPMPFRGSAINIYTSDNKAKSYYVNSGIEIGTYGSSNYICYAATGEDAVYMTNIETLYQDSSEKYGADELHRSTGNDFLKLPSQTWAHTPVKEAAANNLLPYEFTSKYESNITREEFCKLLGTLICVAGNYASLDDYMEDKGVVYLGNYFDDCNDRDNSINVLYALNIVSGKGNGLFDPDGALTREEAATLVCRTAEKFMYIQTYGNLNFSDSYDVSAWAKYYVIWASEQSIMNGDEGRFRPQNTYTVLQAVATVNRAYKVIMRTLGF